MTQSTQTISPLRQRMIDDMRLRKLSPKTQIGYIRAVRRFAAFLGRAPDTANAEDLRRYQLHLVEQGMSSGSLNATITGLKFFFETTLEHPEVMTKMSHVYEPRKLPVILSLEEVTRLLQAAGGPKYQAALGVAYGAGLRANEVVHLTASDIDSERMVIRVEQGKGKRDRYAMLSPTLLELLRAWWRHAQVHRQLLPGGWLFPGQNPANPLSTRQLNRAFHFARKAAEIDKAVSLHSLRHAFATHLLEHHEDIRVIQVLLGHKKLENTARYSQVAAETLRTIAADPRHLGARIGLTLVLHTWGSALTHHPHVHGIVPGGGLSPDGQRWVACRPGFFLPVRVLSRLFRRRFLEALAKAHAAGQLQFFGEYAALSNAAAFADWLNPLRRIEWVLYAKRPFAGPAAVLAYLARYTHRVAIANSRLVALDERGVTFKWKDYRAKGKTKHKIMTLSTGEFMRRFLLHVLPSGFHRIRHYGLIANAGRRENLARARELLNVPPDADDGASTGDGVAESGQPTYVCPDCGAPMIIIETFVRGQPIRAPPQLRGAA